MGVMLDLHRLEPLDEAVLFSGMEPISPEDPEGYAAAVAGIQKSLDDSAAGRHRPLEAVFADMEAPHGVPT